MWLSSLIPLPSEISVSAQPEIPWHPMASQLRFQALFLKPQMELESQVLQQTTQSDAELS